jgi:hypothetical protein
LDLTFRNKIAPIMLAVATALASPLAAQDIEAADITAETLNDAKLDAFVEALIAIEAVRADYLPKIQEQADEAGQKALIEEANTAAIEAVADVENMSPEDYVAIGQAARQDEDLNARIMARLEAVRTE